MVKGVSRKEMVTRKRKGRKKIVFESISTRTIFFYNIMAAAASARF
jgi:hypothetical protein